MDFVLTQNNKKYETITSSNYYYYYYHYYYYYCYLFLKKQKKPLTLQYTPNTNKKESIKHTDFIKFTPAFFGRSHLITLRNFKKKNTRDIVQFFVCFCLYHLSVS